MPEHVHLLINEPAQGDPSTVMQVLKQRFASALLRRARARIRPGQGRLWDTALDAGHIVVSDRYLLANVVYQGYAGGLDVEQLWQIGRLSTGGAEPDQTFVLDLPLEIARSRRGGSRPFRRDRVA